MKVITESALREELRDVSPKFYSVPGGKLLTPAAKEYLQQRKIKIITESETESKAPAEIPKPSTAANDAPGRMPYTDYGTGAYYREKPENMTHLYGNALVPKDHPRIAFRGKLDSLQSLLVLAQSIIHEEKGSPLLLNDLDDILNVLRRMMRAEVMGEAYSGDRIIGLTHAELREHSHNPMKYYKTESMTLPNYGMGKHYALLNQLRTSIRECEVCAVGAFSCSDRGTATALIQELNRLSSALHIMMCRQLSGAYK